ncbi:hypothetical protein DAPPUDRAFT_333307 [Daphnia pulex]|uniref:Uncharacterized protein n=1 Tax=Daphnia pulex TaxID=6669 RepID=E9HSH6_DAPPU|nr:hypothetical protein DAPPUDRAFT_333307 [Daphnia pulex]|eukprot:EFX65308.1 hypothetical protein DAPPUDRAFT_333307 [Daphnia pulex]
MERPKRARKQPIWFADLEVSAESGKVVKGRGGRVGREHAAENVAVVANRPIRPMALETTKPIGAFDLNKLTPEGGFTVDNMHRISSRGSIPVALEEPNLVPTPDDDSDDNGLSGGLSEKSEEKNEDETDYGIKIFYLQHTYQHLTHLLTDENESGVREDESESASRRRREHQQSTERQSLSRSPENYENEEDEAEEATKSDISLGDEPKRWKMVYNAGKKLSSILVDRKNGYKFRVWKVLSNGILYRCTYRPKNNPCKCSVLVIYRDAKREGLRY